MQADTTTLAPCPFCGAQAHFEVDDDDRWEWVECESCGMQGNRSASLMESCKPKLAEAWNRRAPAPASGEAVSPFGYFRAEPFGWTDCAESDEGAKPLYEKPQAHSDLHAAAQALIDRWDAPFSSNLEHIGLFVKKLRSALAAPDVVEELIRERDQQRRP